MAVGRWSVVIQNRRGSDEPPPPLTLGGVSSSSQCGWTPTFRFIKSARRFNPEARCRFLLEWTAGRLDVGEQSPLVESFKQD